MVPRRIGTDAGAIFIAYTVIIALHLAINLLGVDLLAMLNNISAWWHMVGVLVIVVVLIVVPDHHQSAAFVFGQTIDNSGFDGAPFWLVFGLGLLMAQYTITGYDASAHMSEETRLASRCRGLGHGHVGGGLGGVRVHPAGGRDVRGARRPGHARRRRERRRLHLDHLARHQWAEFLLLIAVVAQFFCGTASVTSASRMMFAFSRDGAVPCSGCGGRSRPAGCRSTRSPPSACWPGR